ncbi:alpha/beta fold hydrolase [Sulfitobacter sp. JB4-11]|uniref:alpha/beta fold hydrolase n=1 Tax=Sulfitobacter rhodophyticola TaxID=3238304 RepID=UPI003518CFE7
MTPLVLVHGFMGGSDQWALQKPLAADQPLIRPDLPGFGRNAALPPLDSIAGYARWVLDQLDQQGITRFDLLGHSMGGMIVQEMVRQAPDRIARLILYGTGAVGELPGRFEPIETSRHRAQADGPDATARRIAATWFLDREAAAEYPACATLAAQSSLAAILTGLTAMQGWSGEAHLADITAPTLVLWGDGDRTYPWAQVQTLWQTIPHSNLAVIPGCAHAVHLEKPSLFNATVSDFLLKG